MHKATQSDEVGPRLKQIRKSRGLTLVELSERSGVSRAALSKIERGEISPTYSTLRKVAIGLDETIAGLLSANLRTSDRDIEVVRANEGVVFGEDDATYRLLAGQSTNNGVRCFVSEVGVAPIEESKLLHVHDTDDIMFVLEGSVICHFEGRPSIQLNKGDSVSYPGNTPHSFAHADKTAREGETSRKTSTILWITTTRAPMA